MSLEKVPLEEASSKRLGWGWKDIPDDAGIALRRLADQINFFDKRSKRTKGSVLAL